MSQRQLIRQQVRDIRRNLAPEHQLASAQSLVSQFEQHPLICHAKRVALYLASDGELDTRPVIEWCWARQITVCLPVLHPFSEGHLLFLDFLPDTPMSSNRFGIAEPALNCQAIVVKSAIDIIFTPLVAFDAQGNRLGMGGGFYDRTLNGWHHQRLGPYPIGIAHDCQQVAQVPVESWDVPLPEILTPSHRWHWPM
jgi:5-formyltetrahydrofolate cyclo-ligase